MMKEKKGLHRLDPKDVWELLILPKLGLQDYVRFAAVCRSWRSMAAQNLARFHQLPWFMISRDKTTRTTTFFSLSESKLYTLPMYEEARCCIGSFQGYLVMAPMYNVLDKRYILVNPFSQAEICLPLYIRKYLIGEKAILWKKPGGDHATQLVAAAFSRWSRSIAMCRSEDKEWSRFGADNKEEDGYISEDEEKTQGDDDTMYFKDALFYKDKLHGLTTENRLYTFELLPDSKTLAYKILNLAPMNPPPRANRTYLVESQGKLLMVYRFWSTTGKGIHTTKKFMVYELVESSSNLLHWAPVKSLGDHMLFLGENMSVSISAKNIPAFKGNCIYFSYDTSSTHYFGHETWCLDNGIFYLDDERIESFLPPEYSHPSWFEPMWITPDITLREKHVQN